MALRLYRVIVFQAVGDGPDDGWDAIFPAFPGCASKGGTQQQALENAREALALHIEAMVAQSEPLPAASALNEALPDWVIDEEAGMQGPVHAFMPMEIPGKSIRLNITMDEALVERLDAGARREGATRSGYLAQAVREKLQRGHEQV